MATKGLFPCHEGWLSQAYKTGIHKGIDIGWIDTASIPIRAWKAGTCIASGIDSAGAYYVVLSHSDGRWSGYWHLAKDSGITKGKVVEEGGYVGYRGNTGKSSGVHLHFLITTSGMPSSYNYNTMVNNTVDPVPLCYKLATDKIEDVTLPLKQIVPSPVQRNEKAHQVQVLATALRCRTKPSLNGEIVDTIEPGYYNVISQTTAENYLWDQIEKDRWIATNDKEKWTIDLPVKTITPTPTQDPATDSLLKETLALIETLRTKLSEITEQNTTLTTENTKLSALNKDLQTKNKTLQDSEDKLKTVIANAIKTLTI